MKLSRSKMFTPLSEFLHSIIRVPGVNIITFLTYNYSQRTGVWNLGLEGWCICMVRKGEVSRKGCRYLIALFTFVLYNWIVIILKTIHT